MTKEKLHAMYEADACAKTANRYLNEEQDERRRQISLAMLEAGQRGEDLEPYAEALADLAQEARRMNGPKE